MCAVISKVIKKCFSKIWLLIYSPLFLHSEKQKGLCDSVAHPDSHREVEHQSFIGRVLGSKKIL